MSLTYEAFPQVLDTVPTPVFLATPEGEVELANAALRKVSGQGKEDNEEPTTLFKLGIFHNIAEFQGFQNSFRHGGKVRKLILPGKRLEQPGRRIILYATRFQRQHKELIFGVLEVMGGSHPPMDVPSTYSAIFNHLECFTFHTSFANKLKFVSQYAISRLGYEDASSVPPLYLIDAEKDAEFYYRLRERLIREEKIIYSTSLRTRKMALIPVTITVTKAPVEPGEPNGYLFIAFERPPTQDDQPEPQPKLNTVAKREDAPQPAAPPLITNSAAYQRIVSQVKKVARTETTVLVSGETGTGKELIAQTIHAHSNRAQQPLVIVNCGAIPETLIESELFGYRKGAFTDARSDHPGKFELANGGTIFLDEIGEMPLNLQVRLLRVLQEGKFTPLGATRAVSTDVRIIAATNRDLKDDVLTAKFRVDLYYRLNVFPIHSLPLRERREDIPVLIEHFLHKYRGLRPGEKLRVDEKSLRALRAHDFPGNVRELENMVQRAMLQSEGSTLQIQPDFVFSHYNSPVGPLDDAAEFTIVSFEDMQRDYIRRVLDRTDGKVSGAGGAAELLGLKAQTLFSKMRKLGIDRK